MRHLITLMLTLSFLSVAHAQAEREQTDPTGWLWYFGQTPAQITAHINQGFRLVDLDVDRASPPRFNAAFVRNSGAYASGWWWYYGQTANSLAQRLQQHQARLIDLEVYHVNGQRRFAAVMVPNTGAQAKAWWWYHGISLDQLVTYVNRNRARVVDVERFEENGVERYAVVMIRNTGADARGWWHYYGVTGPQLGNLLGQNQARLVDLEPVGNDRFIAVMNRNSDIPPGNAYWWWYYGTSPSHIGDQAARNGARIVDIEKRTVRYGWFTFTTYAAVMVNNTDPIATRVGNILRADATGGQVGAYLKRVNGPVLAALQPDRIFEPASALKILHLTRALMAIQDGEGLDFDDVLTVCADAGDCPTDLDNCNMTEQRDVEDLLERMMRQSNNHATHRFLEYFTADGLNDFADDVGMPDTEILHRLCGDDWLLNLNETTLADLGHLLESVATGLLDPDYRDAAWSIMSGRPNQVNAIIDAEGASAGLSAAQIASFKSLTRVSWKGGGATWNNEEWRSFITEASVPFRARGFLFPREFVLGAFIDRAQALSQDDIIGQGSELLREQIRAAMQTW